MKRLNPEYALQFTQRSTQTNK